MNSIQKKSILMGITGGIAAYKTVACASKLTQAGFEVHVAMSPGALQFVRPLSFAAVTGNRVVESTFPDTNLAEGGQIYPHIFPASQADLFLLAPASADMLAKIALGFGDDVVCASALALSDECRKLFCPAMHINMWSKSCVQRNASSLREDGWTQIGPQGGHLACGSRGTGRMTEPEEIADKVDKILKGQS